MGVAERKERERRERVKTILAAARDLFFEKGYRATMEEIAERAELSKGTLYLYFKSKDELYISVILEGFHLLEERLKRELKRAKGVEDRVRAIYYGFIDHCLENRAYFRTTQYFLTEDARANTSPDLVETINRSTAELMRYGVREIEEGMEKGFFRRELDPGAIALAVWRMATGILDLAVLEGDGEGKKRPMQDVFETAIEMVLRGIKAG
ncbi:MAG: helix-turn-helix transcriptional regulator [Actinobacteria bacterium]|nr:helix-turn-helix transcriptional regulator [Actinomycetota bacterium]